MPDTASGIGPVKSFGSVAEYGFTVEQTPAEAPSQFTGMIESPAPFSVHSTVSPLATVTEGGENEPSAFTFTLSVAAESNDAMAHERIETVKIRFVMLVL
jgi:hypothetical protein